MVAKLKNGLSGSSKPESNTPASRSQIMHYGSKKLILIAGPTAAGKSRFAQEMALQVNGEILNADSQQFYRGLDIGTGKMKSDERKVKHWLLDLCEPGSFMTAMEFVRQADVLIHNLLAEGKVPIIVGGTGLYIRALLEGLDVLPPRHPEIRRRLQEEFRSQGGEMLHRRLKKIDPGLAEKVRSGDVSRLVRFLEIYEVTGQAPSSLLKRVSRKILRYPVSSFWLNPSREILRGKIGQRTREMVEGGWVEEVRGLLAQEKDPRHWQNKPIGYTELAECLSGSLSLEEATQKIIIKTRQYAKRQETFFRGLFRNPAYQTHGSTLKILEEIS